MGPPGKYCVLGNDIVINTKKIKGNRKALGNDIVINTKKIKGNRKAQLTLSSPESVNTQWSTTW